MYTVVITKRAEKQFSKLPENHKKRVLEKLEALSTNPFLGKKLHGKLKGKYSIKPWPYRIIYVIQKKRIKVVVLEIKHRQSVYG